MVWKRHREDIVYRNNYAKFTQNEHLLEALMGTGDRLLVEAAPNDRIWGIGMSEKVAKQVPEDQWKGSNLLGKILTSVRDNIRVGATPPGQNKIEDGDLVWVKGEVEVTESSRVPEGSGIGEHTSSEENGAESMEHVEHADPFDVTERIVSGKKRRRPDTT